MFKEKSSQKTDDTMPEDWKNPKEGRVIKTKSCPFIRGSRKGVLAAILRSVTTSIKKIVGYNTKIIERGGRKIKNLLSNSNP